MRKNEIDYSSLNFDELTEQQKIQLTKQLAKTANERLNRIRKKGYEDLIGGKTQHYLKMQKRKTFSTIPEKLTPHELREEFKSVQHFLMAKSTLTDIKKVSKNKAEWLKNEKDFVIPKGKEVDFNLFLHSDNWKKMSEIYGSGNLFEDIKDKTKNLSFDEINKAFQDFLDRKITKEEYLMAQNKDDLIQLGVLEEREEK